MLAAMLCLVTANAQEALRASLAGVQSAEARKHAESSIGYYNLKLGPIGLRASTALSAEYTDNVNLGGLNTGGDVILRPSLNSRLVWPVTDKNVLNLNLGAGYSYYVDHSRYNRLFLSPDTELAFDVYLGDFLIDLHDRVSITENAYQDPTLSGNGDYAQFQNDAGVSGLWDLNKVVLNFGYDHVDYASLSSSSSQRDGSSELAFTSFGVRLRPDMMLGLVLGGGLISYGSGFANDARQWSAGGFYSLQFSEYLNGRVDLGYTTYSPDTGGGLPDSSGIYAQVSLNHRLNRFVSYSLSGGQTVSLSFFGGSYEIDSVNLQFNWNVLRKISVGTTFLFEHGSQLYATQEVFNRVGGGINIGRAITRKLSAGLGYQYLLRSSNQPNADYTVNTVSLNLGYQF